MNNPGRRQYTCCHLRLVPSRENGENCPERHVPAQDSTRSALVLLPSPAARQSAKSAASPASKEGERRAARRAALGKVARLYGSLLAALATGAAGLWAIAPAWWSSAAWGMLAPYHVALLLLAALTVAMAGDYAVRLDRLQRRLEPFAPPPSPAELGRAF